MNMTKCFYFAITLLFLNPSLFGYECWDFSFSSLALQTKDSEECSASCKKWLFDSSEYTQGEENKPLPNRGCNCKCYH